MRDHGAAPGPELSGARALREWITGERERYARVFLVESGAAVGRPASRSSSST